MERIYKGDLVTLKTSDDLGIVVDVIMRSDQNADWDVLAVMWKDGTVDSRSPRQILKKNNIKKISKTCEVPDPPG